MNLFLQIFLLVDVFIMGVLAATAGRHAYAHFRPHTQQEADKDHSQALPAEVRKRLLKESEAKFETALEHSAARLQQDLEITIQRLNKTLEQLGGTVIGNELQRYQAELTEMRQQAEADIKQIRSGIAAHEDELKAKLAEEIAAEKQRLVKQIDTRLADAVAAFLVETLQHNVDLGAQQAYLTAMLEEHKAELVKGVQDET